MDISTCYLKLDQTTKTLEKQHILKTYFESAKPLDVIWAIYFLMGKRIKGVISNALMKEAVLDLTNIPMWLFQESYHRVGDLSETISLLLADNTLKKNSYSLSDLVLTMLKPLQEKNKEDKKNFLAQCYQKLSPQEIFVLNKLLTGQFRVGVSSGTILKVLTHVSGLDESILAQRLLGDWEPTHGFYQTLFEPPSDDEYHQLKLKPFMLAHPLALAPEELGDIKQWQAEWKWDGIRAQCLVDHGQVQLWSRGEEILNDSFPEIVAALSTLDSKCILDGEILAFKENVLSFHQLQRRINRKKVSTSLLKDVPCRFIAFDLLQFEEQDYRHIPLKLRRAKLESIQIENPSLHLCETLKEPSWGALAVTQQNSRKNRAEGLMIKNKESPYVVGRKTGLWWKWKIDPMTIDGVLIQAQMGHGRRAGIYSDYTFGVWHQDELVPFAKAYSGLTDEQMREVSSFVRKNTLDKFGPVVLVKPELVFEIAFESIQPSARHKSGIAVRFPRILRTRFDKRAVDANTLDDLYLLLKNYESPD